MAISILTNATLVLDSRNIQYAERLIILFLESFQKIYSKENVTYNVHNLLHLAKDVKKYGLHWRLLAPFHSKIIFVL